MSKPLAHQVAGYDRDTDELAVEYELDPETFEKVRELVTANLDDPEMVYSYQLGDGQLNELSDLLGTKLDGDRYDFFLEPSGDER